MSHKGKRKIPLFWPLTEEMESQFSIKGFIRERVIAKEETGGWSVKMKKRFIFESHVMTIIVFEFHPKVVLDLFNSAGQLKMESGGERTMKYKQKTPIDR